jgi:hypothetical protein
MQEQYQVGDKVVVFDGPYWRSRAEAGDVQAPDGRAAVIVADRTPVERIYDPRGNHGQGEWIDGGPMLPRIYEVEHADGSTELVNVHHLAAPAQLAAAQAAAHQQAAAAAQAASDHANKLASEAAALKQAHAQQQAARSGS